MNRRPKMKNKESQMSSDDLTRRIKSLHDEVQAIHQEWKKLHEGPEDETHLQRHSELIDRELPVLNELQRLLKQQTG